MTQVIIPTPEEKAELIRFDRNHAHNAIDFDTQFGADGQLLFDIMIYIAYTYQNTLFGYGTFDPHDFAQKMGYQVPNLLDKHENPEQLINDKRKKRDFDKLLSENSHAVRVSGGLENAFFYTVLDNAFYVGMKKNIVFSREHRSATGEVGSSQQKGMQVLEEVTKHYKKSVSFNQKVYYTYRVNKMFEDNLTNFFISVNLNASKLLRKKNGVYLYSFLKNLQVSLLNRKEGPKYETDTLNFDMLCSIAKIDCKNVSESKRKLKIKVEQVFALTELKGEFSYIRRPKDRFSFQPKIKFYNTLPQLKSPEHNEQVSLAINTRFRHELKVCYYNNGGAKALGQLKNWAVTSFNTGSGSEPYNLMLNCFKAAWEHVNGKKGDDYAYVTGLKRFFLKINA